MNRLLIKLLKSFIRRFAQYHGFIDPVDLVARLTRFGQPSEVAVPTELLRAGAKMHARGLLNSQAIQYNLDWIWPYWVNRQFDPESDAFVPRAFSLTHINLTHRDWTAVGLPGEEHLPVVDPMGLVTPFNDGWSLDCWVHPLDEEPRSPAEMGVASHDLSLEDNPTVRTEFTTEQQSFESSVSVETRESFLPGSDPVCRIRTRIESSVEGWFSYVLRPYNPEGISSINSLAVHSDSNGWMIRDDSGRRSVHFSTPPDRHVLSNFDEGDVNLKFPDPDTSEKVSCNLGMVTAAASYRIDEGESLEVSAEVPLEESGGRVETSTATETNPWTSVLEGSCEVSLPDDRLEFLFRSAKETLLLLSGESIYPGPFTYKRFWFRDASFMLSALLTCGFFDRTERILKTYPAEQTLNGYFCSQKGEWDSNGQVLWILKQFRDVTGRSLPPSLLKAAQAGADWILGKRLSESLDERHAGLLPAGFSAEHFGPNDYYYWDDFWAVKGLRDAAELLPGTGRQYEREASRLLESVEKSMEPVMGERDDRAMPPSPYREIDAGSVGSVVAGYPLQIFAPPDQRLLDTAHALKENCFVDGVFFQEMIHSGQNPYLSLHIAQVLLRAGDESYWPIVQKVGELASETGKWPEAIHPRTGGGCMGDGEHGWAAAEWIMMIRNMFVREEEHDNDRLIIGQGLHDDLRDPGGTLEFGPVSTRYGTVDIKMNCRKDSLEVDLAFEWNDETPDVLVDVPGFEAVSLGPGQTELTLRKGEMS